MRFSRVKFYCLLPLAVFVLISVGAHAAQGGSAGSIRGTVTDPSGAVIPGATVHVKNTLSGLDRTITSDATGQFEIDNVPFNNYELTVSAPGFSPISQNFVLRSSVGQTLQLVMQV